MLAVHLGEGDGLLRSVRPCAMAQNLWGFLLLILFRVLRSCPIFLFVNDPFFLNLLRCAFGTEPQVAPM